MARPISTHLFLLYMWLWWLLHASGLLTVVTAKPTVTAIILTPDADRKEGRQVHMRCVATNLEPDHVVEWRTENPIKTLRFGVDTVSADKRFMFESIQTGPRETTQEFNITNLKMDDTDEYVCNVNYPIIDGGNLILANASVTLKVYSPSESFPICSPDGPITIDNGTELNMRCTSDTANHVAMVEVSPITIVPDIYMWTASTSNRKVSRSLNLTLTLTDDHLTFECGIESVTFLGEMHFCIIGPINVNAIITGTTTESAQIETEPITLAIIAGVLGSTGGVAALVLVLIICRRRSLCKNKPASPTSKMSSEPTSTTVTTGEPHAFENEGIDIFDKRRNYENYNEPSRVNIDASPEPEPSASYSVTTSTTQAAEYNTPPVYAKPHKATALMDNNNKAKIKNPHQPFEDTTKQRYSNPAFDSTDQDSTTGHFRENSSSAMKPIAKVSPITNVPKKPQPYKPKAQRVSDPNDGTPNLQSGGMSSRPKSVPSPPPSNNDAGISGTVDDCTGKSDAPEPHPGEIFYAQVSVLNSRSSNERKPASADQLTYADLVFQPDPPQDGGQSLSPTEPEAMYSRVMKNRPN